MAEGSDMFGFAGGMLETRAANDQHALAMQSLTAGQQDIKAKDLMLQRQEQLIAQMKHMSDPSQASPGPMGPSPISTQARQMASLSMNAGQAFMEQGFFKEGEEYLDKGAKLMENAQHIDLQQIQQQEKMWQTISNLTPGVKSPADWEQAKMLFTLEQPELMQHPEVQKILKQPYSPHLIDMLQKASTTALQQAEIRKNEAQAASADASAQHSRALTKSQPLRDAETAARIDHLNKEGAKLDRESKAGSKKEQEQHDLQEGLVSDIDDLIGQIQADPSVVGARGFLTRGAEIAGTIMGSGSTPAQRFKAANEALLLKLPKALTSSAKSAKDERQRVNSIADLTGPGNTPDIAMEKLNQLRTELIASRFGLKIKSGAVVISPEQFDDLPSGTPFIGPDGHKRVKP